MTENGRRASPAAVTFSDNFAFGGNIRHLCFFIGGDTGKMFFV